MIVLFLTCYTRLPSNHCSTTKWQTLPIDYRLCFEYKTYFVYAKKIAHSLWHFTRLILYTINKQKKALCTLFTFSQPEKYIEIEPTYRKYWINVSFLSCLFFAFYLFIFGTLNYIESKIRNNNNNEKKYRNINRCILRMKKHTHIQHHRL